MTERPTGATARLALAGDTMLGRGVAEEIGRHGTGALFSDGLRAELAAADAVFLNLECCVSDRGSRIPIPGKPFFFRAPPEAAEALAGLGVRAVTLANNHALDYGPEALLDTLDHLAAAGILTVGAGPDATAARAPATLTVGGLRLGLLGVTDHPAEYAAGPDRPGVAHADLTAGVPDWLTDALASLRQRVDVVLLFTHWGPNMVAEPVPHVRRVAPELLAAGASLIVGSSAHVFHGLTRRVLHDLGDFIDDYAVDPVLRNDRGVVVLTTLDAEGPRRTEALPVALDHAHVRLAAGLAHTWVTDRLTAACARLGAAGPRRSGDRLVWDWPPAD
ncbi:CapA family protein [Streptomyces hainanensis]|uniref:CapA family protein n=1 Tax=Streptomyces hainanensis TaxID=402648 RepID=A0A4R4T9T6_9ACTN|nr:CapA family protein [Streptomyces hainanensis]TDC74088.1 CapA family protein [Streptomyces hainanensis]